MTLRFAILLFFSGAAALVLEVAWFRRLAQVAGATSVALAGVLAAVIGGMALGSLLFGVSATDPWTFLGVATVLGGVVIAACWVPGVRAGRTEVLTIELLHKRDSWNG